ncbi:hypothetical protein V1511DRAFT_499502 [Dipodascopsis uninucleata]
MDEVCRVSTSWRRNMDGETSRNGGTPSVTNLRTYMHSRLFDSLTSTRSAFVVYVFDCLVVYVLYLATSNVIFLFYLFIYLFIFLCLII